MAAVALHAAALALILAHSHEPQKLTPVPNTIALVDLNIPSASAVEPPPVRKPVAPPVPAPPAPAAQVEPTAPAAPSPEAQPSTETSSAVSAPPEAHSSPTGAGNSQPGTGAGQPGAVTSQHGADTGRQEPEYLQQFKITEVPVIPAAQVLSRIEYPPIAARQGIEATVYLELYIDQNGVIRKVVVLKDPGYGFAEAAVKALEGVVTTPARADGKPVAVRFRYPIRFKLK